MPTKTKSKDSQKVGGAAGKDGAAAEKIEKAKKPEWDYGANAKGEDSARVPLDENGRMNGVPHNWDKSFAPLGRKDFATKALLLKWKQQQIDEQIKRLQARRVDLDEQISDSLKGPDPKRAKVRKLERYRKLMKELEEQLKAEGVEVD